MQKMQATQSSHDYDYDYDYEPHVAVLAFPFGSHGWTIFNLMLKLAFAAPNLQFSFLSTKKSNDSLLLAQEAAQGNLPDNIGVYDVDDGALMEHVSAQNNPLEDVELFLKATPRNFMETLDVAMAGQETTGLRRTSSRRRKICCLLVDAFLTFADELAEAMNIPWFPVFVAMPNNVSAHIHTNLIHQLYLNPNSSSTRLEYQTLDAIPGLSMLRISDLSDEILLGDSEESLFSSMLSKLGNVLPQATAVIMNFYQELYSSPQLISDLKSYVPSLLNVGFLTQQMPPPPLPLSDSDETGCLTWLDKQKPKSVAYISFGTVAIPPQCELIALSEALEQSAIPFLWSFRSHTKCPFLEKFLQRTSNQGRGKIVSRAPQTKILAHLSIGVHVTHSGANSVCESIANGVPMICRPFFGDHRMNARIVEGIWGIGITVEGITFTKSGVLKSLELIFSREGEKMRENVQALKKVVTKAAGSNGSATRDFNTLVEKISNACKTTHYT